MGRHTFITQARPGKLKEYIHWHDNIFPEVCAGLRAAGITQLTIYNHEGTDTLVMNITTAGDIDLPSATGPDSHYRTNARCKEWEELMDGAFHFGWTELKEVHASDVHWNTALGEWGAECVAAGGRCGGRCGKAAGRSRGETQPRSAVGHLENAPLAGPTHHQRAPEPQRGWIPHAHDRPPAQEAKRWRRGT
jgi:L-rhamnose mutarotase